MPGGRSGPPRLGALIDELTRRSPRGMELGLDRVREALGALGDPHVGLPAVHVAGTNGKGSVCAMIEAAARGAGLRTGLYTSPHLSRFAERIRLGGEPIGDAALERALSAALERPPAPLTFFEALTVAAFVAFRESEVDLAIVEVGLGGRLDATNVLGAPLCTAITSIALDHVDVLGGTLAAIAREKAGILKRGAPAVLGPLAPEADAAIAEVAGAVGAGPVWRVAASVGGRRGAPGPGEIRFERRGRSTRVSSVRGEMEATLALRGAHQAENAAVASGVLWELSGRFPSLARSWAAALAGVRWPGRLERIEAAGGAAVLLDAAHNPHGARALAAALDEEGPGPERTALVFGALADKAAGEMLEALAPRASRRFYASPRGRAAVSLDALRHIAQGEAIGGGVAAVARALELSRPGDVVVVTGSMYLVGEVRASLLGIELDPAVAL